MARLYSNENFPQPVVNRLRELGHDVLTSLDAGKSNQSVPDEEVIRFATDQGRAVLTMNRRHFHTLHLQSAAHAGIVTCTVDANYVALAERIDQQVLAAGILAGKLLRVTKPSA